MDIVSVGPVTEGPDALKQQIKRVAGHLSGDKLAIVFLPIDVDHVAYLRAAEQGLGGAVVGASTGGAAFTERGVTQRGVVAAVLSGPGFSFSVSVAQEIGDDPAGGLARAVRPVVEDARALSGRHHSLLTLADPFGCDGETLLAAVADAVPPHWRLFGGTAGDDWGFSGTRVFAHGEVFERAAVLVGLFTDSAPSLATRHGWCAAKNSCEFTVTGVDGARLLTLNGDPAAVAYQAELRRLGLLHEGDDPIPVMAKYELGARTVHGNELKIRAPLSLGPDGSVLLASPLPVGTVVRVVTANPDRLIGAASELSRRALGGLSNGAVRGALVFDCAARLQLLGDRYAEQVQAFSGGRSFPMVGMACYGEIARFGGSVEGFHNSTAVMAVW